MGNKIDLEENRQVNFNELKEFGLKKDIEVIETSAKNSINIDESFQKIVDIILSKKSENEIFEQYGTNQNADINLNKGTLKKNEKCCFK